MLNYCARYRQRAVTRSGARSHIPNIKKTEPLPGERSGFVPIFQGTLLTEHQPKKLGGFGNHAHDDVGGDVGEKADRDREFAHALDGAERRTNLALLDLEAELVNSFSDVGVGHRTEQAAVNTGLARDFDHLAVELFSRFLSLSDTFSLQAFEFSATSFEFFDRSLGSTLGVTLGDQEVTGVAILNLNDGTEITEVIDLFEKNDLND